MRTISLNSKRVLNSLLPILSLSLSLFLSSPALAAEDQPVNPEKALTLLKEGNERFVKDKSICPNRNQDIRETLASQQRPFAVIVGCSDSRIPPEIAFDQGLGDLFVVRIAGNIVGAAELDSIEYSAIVNHSSLVVVLGHTNCGAVTAVLNGQTAEIDALAALIKPAISKAKTLDDAIVDNVRYGMVTVKKSSPISKLMKEGKIKVVGAFYDLNTGEVKWLEEGKSEEPKKDKDNKEAKKEKGK